MSGTISASTSNFASELLLNKIMNGQLETSTGKGVSSIGRAISSRLNTQAHSARILETNMLNAAAEVNEAQTTTTAIKDQLEFMKKSLNEIVTKNLQDGSVNGTDIKALKPALVNAAATIKTFYDKVSLLNPANKQSITANTGGTLKLTVGGIKMMDGAFKSVYDKMTITNANWFSKTADADKWLKHVQNAISEMSGVELAFGAQLKALEARQLTLAERGATLDTMAASQGTVGAGGATSLLNNILGVAKA